MTESLEFGPRATPDLPMTKGRSSERTESGSMLPRCSDARWIYDTRERRARAMGCRRLVRLNIDSRMSVRSQGRESRPASLGPCRRSSLPEVPDDPRGVFPPVLSPWLHELKQ